MARAVKLGLWAAVSTTPATFPSIAQYLATHGPRFIRDTEPETLHWLTFTTRAHDVIYAFDAFANEDGKSRHLKGQLARETRAMSLDMTGTKCEVLGMKVDRSKLRVQGHAHEGVTVGVRMRLNAKADKVDALRAVLKDAVSLSENEATTPLCFALEFTGTRDFSLLAFFEDETARRQHASGPVTSAVLESRKGLLCVPPEIVEFDVIATAKLGESGDVLKARY